MYFLFNMTALSSPPLFNFDLFISTHMREIDSTVCFFFADRQSIKQHFFGMATKGMKEFCSSWDIFFIISKSWYDKRIFCITRQYHFINITVTCWATDFIRFLVPRQQWDHESPYLSATSGICSYTGVVAHLTFNLLSASRSSISTSFQQRIKPLLTEGWRDWQVKVSFLVWRALCVCLALCLPRTHISHSTATE